MDIYDEVIIEIWRVFKNNNLKYIMVGGFAVNLHGFCRTTGDVDIWIKDNPENRQAFRKSLNDLKYGDMPQIASVDFIPGWTTFTLNSGTELDVMTHLKGFEKEKFDECLEYASIAKVLELEIPFLHINHLIREKKSLNRPKDQIDVLELERIKSQREI